MGVCAGSHASACRNGAPSPREEFTPSASDTRSSWKWHISAVADFEPEIERERSSYGASRKTELHLCCCAVSASVITLRGIYILYHSPRPPNIFQAKIWQMSVQPGRLLSSEM